MSIAIAPDLWQQCCQLLQANPNCQVTLHQQQGRIVMVEYQRCKRAQVQQYRSRLLTDDGRVLTLHSKDSIIE